MLNRSFIIVSFVLATLLAAGGVELLCRNIGQALVSDSQPIKAATNEKTVGKTPGKPLPTPVRKTQKVKKKENYSIITKRSLFGKVEVKETKKVETPAATLKATSLDLILLGTISGDSNVQRAIIQDKKKKTQDIYYSGDSVGSASIKEVRRGKIILTVNGKDEILLMKEPKSSQVPDKVKPQRVRRKKVPPPPADTEDIEDAENTKTASPVRRLTLKPDDTQETD